MYTPKLILLSSPRLFHEEKIAPVVLERAGQASEVVQDWFLGFEVLSFGCIRARPLLSRISCVVHTSAEKPANVLKQIPRTLTQSLNPKK